MMNEAGCHGGERWWRLNQVEPVLSLVCEGGVGGGLSGSTEVSFFGLMIMIKIVELGGALVVLLVIVVLLVVSF